MKTLPKIKIIHPKVQRRKEQQSEAKGRTGKERKGNKRMKRQGRQRKEKKYNRRKLKKGRKGFALSSKTFLKGRV